MKNSAALISWLGSDSGIEFWAPLLYNLIDSLSVCMPDCLSARLMPSVLSLGTEDILTIPLVLNFSITGRLFSCSRPRRVRDVVNSSPYSNLEGRRSFLSPFSLGDEAGPFSSIPRISLFAFWLPLHPYLCNPTDLFRRRLSLFPRQRPLFLWSFEIIREKICKSDVSIDLNTQSFRDHN